MKQSWNELLGLSAESSLDVIEKRLIEMYVEMHYNDKIKPMEKVKRWNIIMRALNDDGKKFDKFVYPWVNATAFKDIKNNSFEKNIIDLCDLLKLDSNGVSYSTILNNLNDYIDKFDMDDSITTSNKVKMNNNAKRLLNGLDDYFIIRDSIIASAIKEESKEKIN